MPASLHAARPLLLGRCLLWAMRAPFLDGRPVAARLCSSAAAAVQPGWAGVRCAAPSWGAGAASCRSWRRSRLLPAAAAARGSEAPPAKPPELPQHAAAGAAAGLHAAAAVEAPAGQRQQKLRPDWAVGAALAGASFEAYCLLEERGIPERHACGAEVYYLDRQALGFGNPWLACCRIQTLWQAPAVSCCALCGVRAE
ncbi:hypothetical protein ABPG75_008115 [Micractinium tetrahymenae]